MMMANELASRLGLMKSDEEQRIKKLLLKYKLPVAYDIQDTEAFYEAFFLDKKSLDSKITFIVPHNIGGVELKNDIDKDIVMDVLNTYAGTVRV